MERRGTVQSTEQFIDIAASTSNSSGKPYEVKCGSAASVHSREWLTNELAKIRAAAVDEKPKTP